MVTRKEISKVSVVLNFILLGLNAVLDDGVAFGNDQFQALILFFTVSERLVKFISFGMQPFNLSAEKLSFTESATYTILSIVFFSVQPKESLKKTVTFL